MLTKRIILLVLASVAVVLIGSFLYRSCTSGNRLNVAPHASEEIEKAKRR